MTVHGFDLLYRPPGDDISWWAELTPARVLVFGPYPQSVSERLTDVMPEVRCTTPETWARHLHDGTYAVRHEAEWWVAIVSGTKPATTSKDEILDSCIREDMAILPAVIRATWDSAIPLIGSEFAKGDFVRVLDGGSIGVVKRVVQRGPQVDVTVSVNGVQRQYGGDSLEKIDGDPTDPSYWLTQPPASAEDFSLALTSTKMSNALSDVLYSYASSKTVFRPYQFIPAIKLLQSSSGRLLIADEVGLGKTIEAGLIWSELEQRILLRRVLLVTPASLRGKWRAEMARRFDRDVDLLTVDRIADFTTALRAGRDPEICGVISLESLRRPQGLLAELAELGPRFDLIIVDEAHALRNRGTSSFNLGQHLSDWADHLIFLSATPINLGNDDLFNLVNLLEGDHYLNSHVFRSQLEPNAYLNAAAKRLPEARTSAPSAILTELRNVEELEYGKSVANRPGYRRLVELLSSGKPLRAVEIAEAKRLISELNALSAIFTRTTKRDVPDTTAVREPIRLEVNWTPRERGFYRAVEQLFRAKARRSGAPPGFTMQMPLRQAASCIPAMVEYLRERIRADHFDDVDDWLSDAVDDSNQAWSDDGDLPEDDAWDVTDLVALQAFAEEVGEADSKFDALLVHLRHLRAEGMPQIMLFSFFRRTLAYLHDRLRGEFRTFMMTGSTPLEERERIMRAFRNGEFDVLLLSEVGSEGLDFEFCNVLVNYDLPWNPMKVEQRIGRLDRFGQTHDKIFVINMHAPGTIETDIFERLYARIGVFEQSIGELEPILESNEFRDLPKNLLSPELTDEQRQDRIDLMAESLERKKQDIMQLEESRGLLSYADRLEIDGITDAGPSDGRYVGPSEMQRLVTRLLAEYGASLEPSDDDGGVFLLKPTEEVRRAFAGYAFQQGGRNEFQQFQRQLNEDGFVPITFSNEVASRTGITLFSGRHPLVRFARDSINGSATFNRFACVTIPRLSKDAVVLARIDLAESSGLSPQKELWVSGLNIHSGREDPEIEKFLMIALAEGTLADGTARSVKPEWVDELDRLHALRRDREERRRRTDNEALVDLRIRARQQLIDGKIASALKGLSALRERSRGVGVIRATEARISRLQHDRENVPTEMASKRRLTLSTAQIAYALIAGQP